MMISQGWKSVSVRLRMSDGQRTDSKDAGVLLKHPPVAEFLDLIQEKAAKKAVLSLESHLDKLAELRDMAAGDGSYAAAITAEKARGQVVGLYVEKQQVQGDIIISWKEHGTENPD